MKPKNKVQLFIISILVLVIGISGLIIAYSYFYQSFGEGLSFRENSSNTDLLYKSEEWNLSFVYENAWKISEEKLTEEIKREIQGNLPVGALMQIKIDTENHFIGITRYGTGAPDEGTYKSVMYRVNGRDVTARESFEYDKHILVIPLLPHCIYQIIVMSSEPISSDFVTKFLSNFVCSRKE